MAINEYTRENLKSGSGTNNTDLFNQEKQTIANNIKVAAIAYVKQVNSDGTVSVAILPEITGDSKRVVIVETIVSNVKVGEVVLVLFLDRNFKNVLKQLKNGESYNKLVTISDVEELHSENYGLIINKVISK